ncbi:MAG: GspMb/PilO family protein [Verrucomicrobiales bacterium]
MSEHSMNDSCVFRRQIPPSSVLLAFVSLLAGAYAVDQKEPERPALPLFETEEISAPKLEQQVQENAEESGVRIDALLPHPPVIEGKFIGIGLEGKVGGTTQQVVKFLSGLENRDQFRVVPELAIIGDRKDPDLTRASFRVVSWYAKNEKSARRQKKWHAAVAPATPAIEIFASCAASLEEDAFSVAILPPAGETEKPEPPIRLTRFGFTGDSITLSGEGLNSATANKFGGKLFSNKSLDAYDWHWLMRPRYNTKKKDGTVEFSVSGQLGEKAKKKQSRRKEG